MPNGLVMGEVVYDAIIRLQLEFMKPIGLGILGPEILPDQIQPRLRPYAREAIVAIVTFSPLSFRSSTVSTHVLLGFQIYTVQSRLAIPQESLVLLCRQRHRRRRVLPKPTAARGTHACVLSRR